MATASAGHAEYQAMPGLLAVPAPEAVSDKAAPSAVATIALQGLRQAEVGVGGSVAVIGLGLVGQLTVRLALASGLNVIGTRLRDWGDRVRCPRPAEPVRRLGAVVYEALGAGTPAIVSDAAGFSVLVAGSMRGSVFR